MRQRFASKPPPAVAFMGRFGFEALGCFAVFLCRCRERHHVFAFLCFVKLQRQCRDRGTTSVRGMDRPRLMAKMVHGFAFRHARRTRTLRPGVTIRVQAAPFSIPSIRQRRQNSLERVLEFHRCTLGNR